MPKKSSQQTVLNPLITMKLTEWGVCIRNTRIRNKLRASDICARMDISAATLRRLESGDPGAGIGLYLTVFHILGVLKMVSPMINGAFLESPEELRVRLKSKRDNDDYF